MTDYPLLFQGKRGLSLLRHSLRSQRVRVTPDAQQEPFLLTDCLLLCSQQWELRCEAGAERGGHIPASEIWLREW